MWRLFRYRPVNDFLWQELELCELYCCAPSELNDVFDCQLDWRSSIQRALASTAVDASRRTNLQLIQKALGASDLVSKIGVCCFTANAADPLMWAHYADAHRGVCLMYEIPDDHLSSKYPGDGEFYLIGGSPIRYGDNAFFDWLTTGDLAGPPLGDAPVNAVTRLMTSKGDLWAHEQESRVLTNRPGKLVIEPEFLTQVMFGINTPDEHRKRIAQLATRRNAKIVQSDVKRSTTSDFGLDFPEQK